MVYIMNKLDNDFKKIKSLEVEIERIKFLKKVFTNNELDLLKKYNINKLKKYYKASFNRYDWEFIDKDEILNYCQKRFSCDV